MKKRVKKKEVKTLKRKEKNKFEKPDIKFIIGLFLVIILTVIVYSFDDKIIGIVDGIRDVYLDYVFLSIGFASNVIIIFFFLTSLFLWSEHKRRWIFPLWLASFISFETSYLIKVIIKRPRPFEKGIILVLNIALNFIKDNFNTWNFSFPSFQAMLVFSALPILNKKFNKLKYIWLVFACLVAFSRVYFGVHYLSDVLGGAVIGYLIGYICVFIEERYEIGVKLMSLFKIKK